MLTFNDFIVKYYNQRVAYHDKYRGECVQIVRVYLDEVCGVEQFPGVVGAADMWQACPESQYLHIPNTIEGVPEPGDILVWGRRVGRSNGHTELFVMGDRRHQLTYGQNNPLWSGCHVSWRDYLDGLIGWLRLRPT